MQNYSMKMYSILLLCNKMALFKIKSIVIFFFKKARSRLSCLSLAPWENRVDGSRSIKPNFP